MKDSLLKVPDVRWGVRYVAQHYCAFLASLATSYSLICSATKLVLQGSTAILLHLLVSIVLSIATLVPATAPVCHATPTTLENSTISPSDASRSKAISKLTSRNAFLVLLPVKLVQISLPVKNAKVVSI